VKRVTSSTVSIALDQWFWTAVFTKNRDERRQVSREPSEVSTAVLSVMLANDFVMRGALASAAEDACRAAQTRDERTTDQSVRILDSGH
jgi:tetrahydromethanopterin S-methyltransferase subunit H